MKVTEMRVTPVAMADPPLRNSVGVHQPVAVRVIVQLFTDEGLVGLGETAGGSRRLAALEAACDAVVGKDPFHLSEIREAVPDPGVFAPIEVACLDLMGKAVGRPVCDLLGGPVREEVEFSAYLFYKEERHEDYDGTDDWGEVLTPEAIVGEARRFERECGVRVHKLKGGVLPPDEEVETLRLLREALGPEAKLRVDPNGIWKVQTAIKVAREAAEIGLEYYEDPVTGMDDMAEVRRNTDIPLATNMCVTAFSHLPEMVEKRPVDVILVDHHVWGGLKECVRLSRFCADFGLETSMHSNSHFGISMAAMVHLGAAMPHLTYACDTHYPWLDEDIVAGEPFAFREGRLALPEGPGLGVELDEEKFARAAGRYRRYGITDRDDAGEMRKRAPDWVPITPRW
jgi:glucarate dehydratase